MIETRRALSIAARTLFITAVLVTAVPADAQQFWFDPTGANKVAGDGNDRFKADHCTLLGKRQHSAILKGIPFGASWEAACAVMPANINGTRFAAPTRCVNTAGSMWGEFDVPDDSCPHWGDWRKEQCETIPGTQGLKGQRYAARLWDAPKGTTWQAACAAEPVQIGKTILKNGPHLCAPEGNIQLAKAITKGVIKGGAVVGGAAAVQSADSATAADALGAIATELEGYFKQNDVASQVGVVDARTEAYEMWGVVWLPESGCGLP